MAKEYYFISDLHIGGEGELDRCDFEHELVSFLKGLEKKDKNTELIIVGDTFGFWEVTSRHGVDKIRYIIKNHKELFDQFKKTGEKIRITIIPGNHDYELACYREFMSILKGYNIRLEQKVSIIRLIAGKKLWIEHGNQYDENNYFPDFGNPHAWPVGYFINQRVIQNATKKAIYGRDTWLRDISSVHPNDQLFHWMFSNYFYREMSPLLRYSLLPFLMLFSVTILVLVVSLLEKLGVVPFEIITKGFGSYLWIFGNLLDIIFIINGLFILLLILLSAPFSLVVRDLKKTLRRYGFTSMAIKADRGQRFRESALDILGGDPQIALCIFAHSHVSFLSKANNQVIINTGTWLKKLKRIKSRFSLLPDVYYPSFRLNYFRVYSEPERIVVEYRQIPKKTKLKLTLLQHLAIFGRQKDDGVNIPDVTYIDL